MKKNLLTKIYRTIFWIVVWYVVDQLLYDRIPFAGPVETLQKFAEIVITIQFWYAVWTTFWGILAGFFLSLVVGTILGYVAFVYEKVDFVLAPFMDLLRYIPMISFTIIMIIWSSSSALAFETSTFLSLPIIYKQTVAALKNGNWARRLHKINELKQPLWVKMDLAYEPATMPEYITGCHRAINMCWKSGIIAQMLGGTRHSIGSMLFTAKESIDMASIFSWTFVIVICSIGFEYAVLTMLSRHWVTRRKVHLNELIEQLEDEDVAI